MKSNQFFDFSRFIHTLKADLLPNRKALLIGALAAMGVMIFFTFLDSISPNNANASKALDLYQRLFPIIAFIAGLFITAATFKPLADSRIAHGYLGLPASHFEKYLSKWLLTGPLYMIGAMALIALSALVSKLLVSIYPGVSLDLGQLLSKLRLDNITGYLMPHAIFLLGAIAFKRLAFWKTLLALFATLMAWSLFTGLTFRLVFAKYFNGMSMSSDNVDFHIDGSEFFFSNPENAWWIGGLIAFLVWATFNVAGYFKLKETEV